MLCVVFVVVVLYRNRRSPVVLGGTFAIAGASILQTVFGTVSCMCATSPLSTPPRYASASQKSAAAALLSVLSDPRAAGGLAAVFGLSALVTLAILYYYGPPTNDRAVTIIAAAVRLGALVAFSAAFSTGTVALGALLCLAAVSAAYSVLLAAAAGAYLMGHALGLVQLYYRCCRCCLARAPLLSAQEADQLTEATTRRELQALRETMAADLSYVQARAHPAHAHRISHYVQVVFCTTKRQGAARNCRAFAWGRCPRARISVCRGFHHRCGRERIPPGRR